MAVENHPTHEKVKHERVKYGCWNLPRTRKPYKIPVRILDGEGNYIGMGTEEIQPVMSPLCRHTGEYSKDRNGDYSWKEDPNCEGCLPIHKDHEYIYRMRRLVEEEVRKTQLHL